MPVSGESHQVALQRAEAGRAAVVDAAGGARLDRENLHPPQATGDPAHEVHKLEPLDYEGRFRMAWRITRIPGSTCRSDTPEGREAPLA